MNLRALTRIWTLFCAEYEHTNVYVLTLSMNKTNNTIEYHMKCDGNGHVVCDERKAMEDASINGRFGSGTWYYLVC